MGIGLAMRFIIVAFAAFALSVTADASGARLVSKVVAKVLEQDARATQQRSLRRARARTQRDRQNVGRLLDAVDACQTMGELRDRPYCGLGERRRRKK